MEIVVFATRCVFMVLVTWLGLRIIGKKSIAQTTSYDLAGIFLISNIAAEPLVYKIPSKATEGIIVVALCLVLIGKLSLSKWFYDADQKPSILIANGKINLAELKKNNMNLPFLFSQLRLKNITKVADVAFAIVEPDGALSVIPIAGQRALTPNDLNIETPFESLALPIIIDGEIQYNNLKYAKLGTVWLSDALQKQEVSDASQVLLAELDSKQKLYIYLYSDFAKNTEDFPPLL